MMDWIAGKVTDEIHEVAGSDPLIGYKTVSGFIQEVLVPELATMLIAEDMDVQEARAREILGESEEIGDLVNQAKEERVEIEKKTVKDDDDDDDED
ncbi:uncharacterized protein K452DRAFT_283062 [Aplosporella prunicola CBS 121167]|uniref:Restriction of telomere capping protein 4 n=1 Tax=Aplosporella prunicola CBS 121167 TaxID=1176127 RepID=A0A6A6BVY4_9PEZI|nr:uncharacterized protein K452DRAFT_283062 [Aplosporella prunicola CBS 121167]KAF2146861.1 hypothetical protein K452DRAFT_283062 [Aplosporella prunicola CBS 121167]